MVRTGRLLVAATVPALLALAVAPAAALAQEGATGRDDSFFTAALLPLSLAVIMVSLGLSLTIADFARVVKFPKGVAIGLVNLLVVSPLLAFGIANLFGLEAGLAVGLVLLGASPGGTTANLLTHVARGDTALSITMTAISSVAAVVTVPLYLGFAIDFFDTNFENDPEMVGVAARVFFITVVPLAIGMWIRSRWTGWATRVESRARQIALGLFIVVIAGTIANESEAITDHFAELAAATLVLNVAAMAISFNVARLARLSRRQSTAIAMELGVHNGTVAITVGAGIATILTSPAAVYSAFMFITAGLFARLMYVRNAAEAGAGDAAQAPPAAPAPGVPAAPTAESAALLAAPPATAVAAPAPAAVPSDASERTASPAPPAPAVPVVPAEPAGDPPAPAVPVVPAEPAPPAPVAPAEPSDASEPAGDSPAPHPAAVPPPPAVPVVPVDPSEPAGDSPAPPAPAVPAVPAVPDGAAAPDAPVPPAAAPAPPPLAPAAPAPGVPATPTGGRGRRALSAAVWGLLYALSLALAIAGAVIAALAIAGA